MPGASVTLKKRAANDTYVAVASTVTSATGTYSFANIKPARYSITVTKTGYAFGAAPEFSTGPNATIDVNATAPTALRSPTGEGMDNAN